MFIFLKSILQKLFKRNTPSIHMQARLSPYDERDYTVGSVMEVSTDLKIPSDFTVWQPPVENQGSTGNCVAQSVANIMECIEHKYGGDHKDYSVGFIYGSPSNCADWGMFPRDACHIVTHDGELLRSEFECTMENPACKNYWYSSITPELKEKAKTRQALAYVHISTKEEMQAFMLKYNLPVMIVAQSSAFYPSASGRHATVCYGWISEETYNNNVHEYCDMVEWGVGYQDILFTNSWGVYYHNKGRGACKFNDIEEIWGIVPVDKIKLTDIENCWAKEDIQYLVDNGLVNGYEDNTFRPDEKITRAEMAALLARALREIKG